jgi:hypothetical protein
MPDARPSPFNQLTTIADWEKFFAVSGAWDGIDGTTSFAPTISGGNINISAGQCFIKGQLWDSTVQISTPLLAHPATNPRIDVLVIRFNRVATTSPTVIQPFIIQGTEAASPAVPPIVQNPPPNGVWDIPVARWQTSVAGVVSGLTDIRQFSGKSMILMFSTARPSPVQPRLGLEIDTGNVMRWDGSVWQSAIPATPPKAQTWHWTFGGAAPGVAEAVIPGSQQSINVNFPSMLIIVGLVDIGLPASGGGTYTAFAQLDGANVEGNSFIVAQGPGIRLTLSRTWAATVTTGTHQVDMAHNISAVVSGTAMRGGALTVLAVPT